MASFLPKKGSQMDTRSFLEGGACYWRGDSTGGFDEALGRILIFWDTETSQVAVHVVDPNILMPFLGLDVQHIQSSPVDDAVHIVPGHAHYHPQKSAAPT